MTITDLKPNVSVFICKLSHLENASLVGRWEDTRAQQLAVVDGSTTLFNVVLWTKPRHTQSLHQYVTDKRDFTAVRNDILQALHYFMTSRLAFDDDFDSCISSMAVFVNFTATDDDIRKVQVHKTACCDVDDLAELADSYKSVQLLPRQRDTPQTTGKSSQTARKVLKTLCRINANSTTACEDNQLHSCV